MDEISGLDLSFALGFRTAAKLRKKNGSRAGGFTAYFCLL